MGEPRIPRAAGTRGFLDVLRARGRKPTAATSASDIEAIRNGEHRLVSCFFRSTSAPAPTRFRQGMLELASGRANWRPFMNRKDPPVPIAVPVAGLLERARDPKTDRMIKSGGAFAPGGQFQASAFVVLACTSAHGSFELAVPRMDLPLVRFVLGGAERAEAD
jgi:hypothetical protein